MLAQNMVGQAKLMRNFSQECTTGVGEKQIQLALNRIVEHFQVMGRGLGSGTSWIALSLGHADLMDRMGFFSVIFL